MFAFLFSVVVSVIVAILAKIIVAVLWEIVIRLMGCLATIFVLAFLGSTILFIIGKIIF